jgi:hypothetical protein
MEQDTTGLNQDTSTPYEEPEYLKALNSKPSKDKVGQVFVTTTKMPPPKEESEERSNPLKEKILQDIMKENGVDRQEALSILNQNNIKLKKMSTTDKDKELKPHGLIHSEEMLIWNSMFNIKSPSTSEASQREKGVSNANTIEVTFLKRLPKK